MGGAVLLAARRTCEHQARDAIGDAAYEAAYRAGVEMDFDDGIAYTLPASPCGA